MRDKNSLSSVSELVEGAFDETQAYIATIAGHEEEPAMVAYAEYGVPWFTASCQTKSGLSDIESYRAKVGIVPCSAWMDNTTIVTACALMSEKGAENMTPLTIWDLATFMRSVVCYERIYHHVHPDVDDAKINGLLGEKVLVSVPLPTRYDTDRILPDPWDGAHRLMCDIWFDAHGWLKRLHESIGKGTLNGTQIKALNEAWRTALGNPTIKTSDIVNFVQVDHRWRSPSNQLLVDTAAITNLEETRVWLDPDERFQEISKKRLELGLPDLAPQYRSDVLSHLNLRS
jgi:hypothetical protein